MQKKRTPVNWKKLTEDAKSLVTREQNANYQFLQKNLGTSVGVTSRLLKKLSERGIVRRGPKRRWIVIVDTDGKPKNESDLPPKRVFRMKRRKKVAVTVPSEATSKAPGSVATPKQSAKHTKNGFSEDEKLAFMRNIGELARASGFTGNMADAITHDLAAFYNLRESFKDS